LKLAHLEGSTTGKNTPGDARELIGERDRRTSAASEPGPFFPNNRHEVIAAACPKGAKTGSRRIAAAGARPVHPILGP